MTKLINIGFGNLVNAQKIVAIVSPDAAPIKRMVQSAKNDGRVIDATQGRKSQRGDSYRSKSSDFVGLAAGYHFAAF